MALEGEGDGGGGGMMKVSGKSFSRDVALLKNLSQRSNQNRTSTRLGGPSHRDWARSRGIRQVDRLPVPWEEGMNALGHIGLCRASLTQVQMRKQGAASDGETVRRSNALVV